MEEKSQEKLPLHNFTLDSFQQAHQRMIATSNSSYGNQIRSYWGDWRNSRIYSEQEILRIITGGTITEQQELSRAFFYRDGYYKQILMYYATLLNYVGLLIPNPGPGKTLSTPNVQKRYYLALDYIEKMQLPVFLTNCAVRALVDGCYYGIVANLEKSAFTVIDLPAEFCITRFKDAEGNDVIEFNLDYFLSIKDEGVRNNALAAYPKVIAKAYKEWSNGKRGKWFIVPSEIAVCFPLIDGRPPFLNVISASQKYDEAIIAERERDAEEIRKIIVQKIPHLTDGHLLFEPEEAEEIHKGTVGMLKGNPNISVLTTYGDVDAITSKTSADRTDSTLEIMQNNIYSQGAVSSLLFNADNASGLEASNNSNIAFMMIFANKAANYITNVLNRKFANGNVSFKYSFMPVSYQNYTKFATTAYSQVSSGYSFLMPAIAMGLSQRDLGNLKDLENTVLMLGEKLIPLSTAYTQSASKSDGTSEDGNSGPSKEGQPAATEDDQGGRPTKEASEKADTTEKKDKSIDANGGGS